MHNATAVYETRPARRSELVAWYARQPEAVRIEIHQRKIDIQRTWQNNARAAGRERAEKGGTADYAALVAAIAEYWKSVNKAKTEMDFKKRVAASLAKKKTRFAPVAAEIEKMLPLIERLRSEGMSWRQIVEYLKEHHKRTFSVAYLQRICAAWEMKGRADQSEDNQHECGLKRNRDGLARACGT